MTYQDHDGIRATQAETVKSSITLIEDYWLAQIKLEVTNETITDPNGRNKDSSSIINIIPGGFAEFTIWTDEAGMQASVKISGGTERELVAQAFEWIASQLRR